MPPVDSFKCPHCNATIGRRSEPRINVMARVPHTVSPAGWDVHMLVCPQCENALGPYAVPSK